MATLVVPGGEVLVDDEDLSSVVVLGWGAHKYGDGLFYASTKIAGRTVYMHRFIVGADEDVEVDHRNGNGLDNRRSNLRVASHQQNLANQRHQTGVSSRFRGVSRYRGGRWQASIKIDGKSRYVGHFDTEEEAALAWNAAALAAWGEFARLNQIEHVE